MTDRLKALIGVGRPGTPSLRCGLAATISGTETP